MTTRRPVAEGLFEEASDGSGPPWLCGSRCTKCEEVVFPRMKDCPNCLTHESMEPHRMRGHGRLRDFAVVQRGASGFTVPYVQAFIKLDDGPVIYSNLRVAEPDESKIHAGSPVEMRLEIIKTIDGVEYVGWTFEPVEARE